MSPAPEPAARAQSAGWPTVTIVFLVYNRCAELRESLTRTLTESDYEADKVDVIVVDNASTDGSADMVATEFPQVSVMRRRENSGVSAWNEGLAVARGDYVLALDDDCYLPPDGLRRAVLAAERNQADLVSFKVVSTHDPDYAFTDDYLTGLFMFWGCAVLMRRRVVRALGGYDPEIFVWANELEFTLRFFDQGFRHLHLPEVPAQHMKPPPDQALGIFERGYRLNFRHWAYIAAKHFTWRAAWEAFVALSVRAIIDGVRSDRVAFRALPDVLSGFIYGLRRRTPLRNPELARFYRANFETYASPWWLLRPIPQLLRELPRELLSQGRISGTDGHQNDRLEEYIRVRRDLYPERATSLEFSPVPLVRRANETS
jgi:GT2 family glycosyltransferase